MRPKKPTGVMHIANILRPILDKEEDRLLGKGMI